MIDTTITGWVFERNGQDWIGRNTVTGWRTALKGTLKRLFGLVRGIGVVFRENRILANVEIAQNHKTLLPIQAVQ